MEMISCHIKLFIYVIFSKAVKTASFSFNGMSWLHLCRLAKDFQSKQKLCLLDNGWSNRYIFGQVFETAFYFE